MKENDIYRIDYTAEYKKKIFEPRHCFEGVGIVKKISGQLILADTFWGIGNTSGKTFTEKDIGTKIKIDYIENLDNLEPIYSKDVDYFDDVDVIILSRQHGCYDSCISYYKKRGAKKSAEKMKGVVLDKIEDAKRKKETAERDIQKYTEGLEKIESGDLDLLRW